jgi:hypothetical protein
VDKEEMPEVSELPKDSLGTDSEKDKVKDECGKRESFTMAPDIQYLR